MARQTVSASVVSGLVLAALGGAAGCATVEPSTQTAQPAATLAAEVRAAREAIAREDVLSQMAFWAQQYSAFPTDVEAARGFADALRRGGRAARSAEVAQEGLQRFPEDPALLRTFGLAQIANGRPQDALRPLAMVVQADPLDFRTRSALGVALDQLGRYDQARMAYREALAIRSDDPGTLSNLGLSYLLTGDAAEAETMLRQATALPGAPPEARQNLAVALALQGKMDEAEQIARVDLPPQMASANMAYLRGLFQDSRRWGDLQ